jgi:hypothetical protein
LIALTLSEPILNLPTFFDPMPNKNPLHPYEPQIHQDPPLLAHVNSRRLATIHQPFIKPSFHAKLPLYWNRPGFSFYHSFTLQPLDSHYIRSYDFVNLPSTNY